MWSLVEVSGAPPPSRLDHAMCSIRIPVPLAPTAHKTAPPSLTKAKAPQAQAARTQQSHSGGSLSNSSQSSSSSFQAVTIIDPGDTSGSNFSVSQSESDHVTVDSEQVAAKLQGLCVKEESGEEWEWVPALFVFGGMDTAGVVHGDSFILVP